jgi:RNA polymerase sigma-70 factor (ECF subfamily)
MELYREQIYYMLLKMTKSTTDADDLTIEAFGKAFKSIDKYTPEFAFSTWLFRIATNNCVDYIRKKKAQTVSIETYFVNDNQDVVEFNITSPTPNPEEKIIEQQKHQILRNIIKELKPHYKILVEKRYFEEKSYEEIATELNMPIGTVKAKLFRAKEFLYNLLKDNKDF